MSKQPSVTGIAFDMLRAERQGEAGLAQRRERRFAALLRHARAESPFYRRLYGGLAAGNIALRDLPPITKQELMADFNDWVTDPRVTRTDVEAFVANPALVGTPYRGELFACTSSGTTGHPGLFLHDQYAIAVYRALTLVRIDLGWLNASHWLRLARRGIRWAAVMGTGGHFAGVGWMELDRRRSAWRSRAYRVFSVQRPLDELVAELKAFDPTILSGYPSALELLAGEQAAGRLHLKPVLVESAGESMTADAGSRMAAAFGCEIHNAYGASEFPCFALSCSHGWLHVSSDWAILEPVDENFRPTPAGEASYTVLLTNLANRIQPIIRYDLGDSVLARPDPCPCGSHLPAIRVAGRRDDVLRLSASDGRTVAVLPLAIGAIIEETPGVHRSQLIQVGPATIRLRLEPQPGANVEQLWRDAAANLSAYLAKQGLPGVKVVRANEAPEQSAQSGKFRQVIAAPRTGAFATTSVKGQN
ncbi:MAG: phenylacetate--CoA ligase family protein [Rhodoferax sp.]|nr:phenylacetate--CoA ligase family protein [Rhodoferax sp.]